MSNKNENSQTYEIKGLEELQQDLKKLIKKYPDYAGECLKKNARDVRKDVTKLVKSETKSDGTSKRSLTKAKEYKISRVFGLGEMQYVELSAKAPHFHLVEHGHELVAGYPHKEKSGEKKGKRYKRKKDKKVIGFVQGKHMMETAVKRNDEKFPETVEEMVERLLKHGGFL